MRKRLICKVLRLFAHESAAHARARIKRDLKQSAQSGIWTNWAFPYNKGA